MDQQWLFVEISHGPQYLLQKLWQLERAVHILPLLDAKFNPSNLVVLLNGDEMEANLAMENIHIPAQAKILQYPLFIGWTPTRNIFKLLGNLQTGQDELKMEMERGQNELKMDIQGLEKKLEDIKNALDFLTSGLNKK